jgi:hypothetical protein
MKKLLFLMFLFLSFISICAQVSIHDNSIIVENTYIQVQGEKLRENEKYIQGSPYLNPLFMNAKIAGVSGATKMRYNANNDEVEYQTQNGNLAILKEPKFGDIYFMEQDLHLKLVTYNYNKATITGYLFELIDKPNLKIYKREHINYYEAKAANNSYDNATPATFKLSEPTYFIQRNGGEITELPSNKKKLIALFPDKKEAIIQYFKNNKGDFSKKNDLEKLADIL